MYFFKYFSNNAKVTIIVTAQRRTCGFLQGQIRVLPPQITLRTEFVCF